MDVSVAHPPHPLPGKRVAGRWEAGEFIVTEEERAAVLRQPEAFDNVLIAHEITLPPRLLAAFCVIGACVGFLAAAGLSPSFQWRVAGLLAGAVVGAMAGAGVLWFLGRRTFLVLTKGSALAFETSRKVPGRYPAEGLVVAGRNRVWLQDDAGGRHRFWTADLWALTAWQSESWEAYRRGLARAHPGEAPPTPYLLLAWLLSRGRSGASWLRWAPPYRTAAEGWAQLASAPAEVRALAAFTGAREARRFLRLAAPEDAAFLAGAIARSSTRTATICMAGGGATFLLTLYSLIFLAREAWAVYRGQEGAPFFCLGLMLVSLAAGTALCARARRLFREVQALQADLHVPAGSRGLPAPAGPAQPL